MGEEFQRILIVFRTCNILIFQTMTLRVQSLINLEISLICSTLILVQMILWEPFFAHLEVFQICRNFILDTIKDSVYFGGEWLSNLTLLTHLDLSHLPNLNSSHVWLQMIGKLPKIQELKLPGCDLSDLYLLCLSRSLLNFSTSLAILDLSQNAFSSSKIFEWVFNATANLIELDLSNNIFKGTILKVLLLRNNSLTGKLPFSLKNCTELIMLDLGDNRFSGPIPYWLGQQLQMLSLRKNQFNGSLPQSLCDITNIQLLDLS